MTHKKQQSSHRLIDLGAATIVTKGNYNKDMQDEPGSLRIRPAGLSAE